MTFPPVKIEYRRRGDETDPAIDAALPEPASALGVETLPDVNRVAPLPQIDTHLVYGDGGAGGGVHPLTYLFHGLSLSRDHLLSFRLSSP